MATPISKIMIIVTTATEPNADSDMFVELHIGSLVTAEEPMAGGLGETKIFELNASEALTIDQLTPADIELSVDGDTPSSFNAWLPGSCFILAKGRTGDYQLVCAIPHWPNTLWLSANPADHQNPPAYSGVLTLQTVLDAL